MMVVPYVVLKPDPELPKVWGFYSAKRALRSATAASFHPFPWVCSPAMGLLRSAVALKPAQNQSPLMDHETQHGSQDLVELSTAGLPPPCIFLALFPPSPHPLTTKFLYQHPPCLVHLSSAQWSGQPPGSRLLTSDQCWPCTGSSWASSSAQRALVPTGRF